MALPLIPILMKLVGPLLKLGGYAMAALHLVGVGKRKVKLKAAETALEQVKDVKDALADDDAVSSMRDKWKRD